MSDAYRKAFAIELRKFSAAAQDRATQVLARNDIDAGAFFAANEFPANVLERLLADAGSGETDDVRDDLVIVMGEWLLHKGFGRWAMGPIDPRQPDSATVIRVGFGVEDGKSTTFLPLVSWAEDLLTGGSPEQCAAFLNFDARRVTEK